jgi:acyl-CoA thioesterase-1
MQIVIFGSSITWGAWDKGGGWAQRIKTLADKKTLSSNFDHWIAVYCLGISGDTSDGLVERFGAEAKARINPRDKNIFLVEIGINDLQFTSKKNKNKVPPEKYKENIKKLIAKSKSMEVEIIFVGLTPVDERVDPIPWTPEYSYKMSSVEQYDKSLREICKQRNVPYIELFSKFPKQDYKKLLLDGVHLTTKGHKIVYMEVVKFLSDKRLI